MVGIKHFPCLYSSRFSLYLFGYVFLRKLTTTKYRILSLKLHTSIRNALGQWNMDVQLVLLKLHKHMKTKPI